MKQCIATMMLALFLCACGKSKNSGSPKTVTPFTQYLTQNKNTAQVGIQLNDTAREIGYTFRAAGAGTIYELGLRVPDSSHAYMVSVWDSATKTPLVQKPIQCTGTLAFTYLDLTATNEAIGIQAQHTYVVSFNTVPVNTTSASPIGLLFGASNTQSQVFPFVEGIVAYYDQYEKYYVSTPTFPDYPIRRRDLIFGLVDIGFKY